MTFSDICDEQDAARLVIRQAVTDMKNAGIREGIYKAANWLRFEAIINRKRTIEQRRLLKELADEMEKGI
jgi:hypothetical protein